MAAAVAAIVGAITNPFAERVSDAYRHGAQTGLVLRYATLGALAAWLVDLLVARARRHGSLRAALVARGWALVQSVALVAVVLAAVLPIFIGGYDAGDRRRDAHAGFINGCRTHSPARYCECVWTLLSNHPAADSTAEFEALMREVVATGTPPPPLRRAMLSCAP